jgi:hypothetical protein
VTDGAAENKATAARALLERGLERYGAGDLTAALADWAEALKLAPALAQAKEYIDYVRDNFDALTEQFAAAGVYDRPPDATPLPPPPGDDLADGLAAVEAGLESVLEEVVIEETDEPDEPDDADDDEPQEIEMEAMAPDEDELALAGPLDLAEALPEHGEIETSSSVLAPPDELAPTIQRPPIMTIQPRPGPQPPFADVAPEATPIPPVRPSRPDPGLERSPVRQAAARSTMRGAPSAASPRPSPSAPGRRAPAAPSAPGYDLDDLIDTKQTDRRRVAEDARNSFPDELPTRERRIVDTIKPSRPPDDFDEHELTGDFDDLRKTSEHTPFRADAPAARRSSPPTAAAAQSPAVIVDQGLLGEMAQAGTAAEDDDDDGPLDLIQAALEPAPPRDPEVTADFQPRRDAGKEAREERARRRVSERLREAQEAAEKGNFLAAVIAVEAAQKEDEEGAVAPVILHRHRDLLYRIYEGHIGDMSAVPLVAVPLHEISAQALDHRTGFLLSRIDGMLTFEDILDVAGMPRMEAYQILSNLLRRGVIEVRA